MESFVFNDPLIHCDDILPGDNVHPGVKCSNTVYADTAGLYDPFYLLAGTY